MLMYSGEFFTHYPFILLRGYNKNVLTKGYEFKRRII